MYEYTVYLYLLHNVTNELDFGGIWDEDSLYLHDAVDIWLVFEFVVNGFDSSHGLF